MKTTQFGGCIDASNCEGLVGAGWVYGEKKEAKEAGWEANFGFFRVVRCLRNEKSKISALHIVI